jgi:hypothetical protein
MRRSATAVDDLKSLIVMALVRMKKLGLRSARGRSIR